MDGFLQWMGSFPILIRLDSELSEMEPFNHFGTAQFRPEKKSHPSFECESLGGSFWSREEVLGVIFSPSTLRFFFAFWKPPYWRKMGQKLGFSRECRLLWISKNGGGLFKKGILIIRIVSYKFLVRFPGF